jgi:hypothetical protein
MKFTALPRVGVTVDRFLDMVSDLLTIDTHDSQLQAITAQQLISTIKKSPEHPLNLF